MTLGNSLLYYLLKGFNQVRIRAIQGPIKYLDLVSHKSSLGRLSSIYRYTIYLYNRQGRVKRLGGVNIYIILPIVVFVKVLQAQVNIILKALSHNITPFLLILKDQRPFLNTYKVSLNYYIRYITESQLKVVGVKLLYKAVKL